MWQRKLNKLGTQRITNLIYILTLKFVKFLKHVSYSEFKRKNTKFEHPHANDHRTLTTSTNMKWNAQQIDRYCLRLFMLFVCHLQDVIDRHQQYASTWYKTSKTWNLLVLQFLCMFSFKSLIIFLFQCIRTFWWCVVVAAEWDLVCLQSTTIGRAKK